MQPLEPQDSSPSEQLPLSSASGGNTPPSPYDAAPPASPYSDPQSVPPQPPQQPASPYPQSSYPQPPSPYPQQYGVAPVAGADKKIAAGLCGIFLGTFGVHKFILGYNTEGIIMAAVSIATCGFAAPLVGLVGLIEGIIYLTKTDQQFVQEYVVNKKPWF